MNCGMRSAECGAKESAVRKNKGSDTKTGDQSTRISGNQEIRTSGSREIQIRLGARIGYLFGSQSLSPSKSLIPVRITLFLAS